MPIPNIDAILQAGVVAGTTQAETLIGLAWLKAHWREWDRVEFNVGLGPGISLPAGTPANYQKAANLSSKPRADIIVYRPYTAGIVELKERIRGSALGQVLTYAHMLAADRPDLVQIYKTVAGAAILEGIQPVFAAQNVAIELFPLAVPPTLSQ